MAPSRGESSVDSPGETPVDVTWPTVLARLAAGSDLTRDQASWGMAQLLDGAASAAQFGAFVLGLRAKGETSTEVQALVEVMLDRARLLDFGPAAAPLVLDVVGTGGDQSHTVNISTMSALVCTAAGIPVVKHGNRAASSSTGTADVLEELGIVIDLEPDQVVATVRELGIGFCFAQVHHPALKTIGPWRRELGIPTVFNILGPLTNPGGARAALIGTASEPLAPVMADVLARRGVRALVVRGEDGLDEISTAAPTRIWDATGPTVVEALLRPRDVGIPERPAHLLRGGDRVRNAELLEATLGAEPVAEADRDQVEAIRDAVALNAAAAMVAYEAAIGSRAAGNEPRDLASRIARQLPRARAVLADGSALALLRRWAELSQSLGS